MLPNIFKEKFKEEMSEKFCVPEMSKDKYSKSSLKKMLLEKQNCVVDFEELLLTSKEKTQAFYYELSRLRNNMLSQDEEERVIALEILVTSQKTTLRLVKDELNCILIFLLVNLREKLEYMHLIKRALKRIKDSLIVMKRELAKEEKMREHYQKNNKESEISKEVLNASYETSRKIEGNIQEYAIFFESLRNMCVNDLYPGSVYCHRKSCLEILCLMQTLLDNEFEYIKWNREQVEKVFQCMLLDTYESNKVMAFNILKSLDAKLLQLDTENRVFEMVKIGVKLGNSIRPTDTITAAYLLKISLLSPVFQTVMQTCFYSNECPKDLTEASTLQLVTLLLKELQKSLSLAKENIVITATKCSLYGHLFCVRNILNNCNLKNAGGEKLWQDVIAELISVCLELSHAVSIVVNNSSPEGHLPMDLETINNMPETLCQEEVTPQMVLLCSWRTVKEVSLLFGQLTTKLPICGDDSSTGLLTEEQIVRIGEHLVTLLSETKHRGAFEQAHVGFSLLCTRLWRLKNANLNRLPIKWLRQILYAITGFAQGNSKLCATRRSAGVPFMVQALLSTEPRPQKSMGSATFHSVMKVLLRLADIKTNAPDSKQNLMYIVSTFSMFEDLFESSKYNINEHIAEENKVNTIEIKTHALNILRAIFRHSQLGELVNNYVADGFIAALKSCDGLTWAERNAATLLFSALIIRIFGVQRTKDHINLLRDNKMTVKNFIEHYPSLLSFIVHELQSFVLTGGVNCMVNIKRNVHPILLLLSRLYLGYDYTDKDIHTKVREIIDLVSDCAKSPVYETRELAARILVPLLTEQTALDVINDLVHKTLSTQRVPQSLNSAHGYMLQIIEIIKHFKNKCFTSLNILLIETDAFVESLESDDNRQPCFPLATVYINILYEIHSQNSEINVDWDRLFQKLMKHIINQNALKQGPGRELYKTSVISLLLSILKGSAINPEVCKKLNVPERIYFNTLNASEHEVQIISWSTVVDIINEISCDYRKTLLRNHCLDVISNSLKVFHKYNPELQDAVFNFLYQCLMCESEFWNATKCDISQLVLNELRAAKNSTYYNNRETYLRLLGKAYVTLCNFQSASDECTEDVYTSFCDSSWISSLNPDFRSSVYSIMHEFYKLPTNDDFYSRLQWWTMLLQLLVDDNYSVRCETSKFICVIDERDTPQCIIGAVFIFFEKFYKFVARTHPEIGCTAFFYWSFSLSDDTDYEMDQTDVFNKCRNYDFLDPIYISRMCVYYLKLLTEQYSLDELLPADARDWLHCRMGIAFPESISFRELLRTYKMYIPTNKQTLEDILDPTYKDKLIQILTYETYKDIGYSKI